MNKMFRLLPILTLGLSFSAHAIVDYSESTSDTKASSAAKPAAQSGSSKSDSRSLIWKSDFSFNTDYEAEEFKSNKVGVINLNTHLQTPFNVYLDVNYWNAQTNTGSQSGNPKVILGFNWLRFGNPADEIRLDFYAGAKFASNSQLASSRTDKIFGAETTKRFGNFGLGLGYDITLTGEPKNATDMGIGNINRISISSGWMVSNDIQFEIEIENFKINQSSNHSRSNYLTTDLTLSTLSPKIILTMAPAVGLELGARFRTNKPKSDQDLATAKLFDIHGMHSNSLFAGLNLNL